MKHHIAIKFIAIFLATLSLLTALGSAAGILILAAEGLYENTFDRVYEEEMAGTRRSFAVNLAHRYASLNLGGLSADYLREYHGEYWLYSTFEYDKFCYVIRDESGDIVESTLFDDLEGATRYDILVTDISYRHVITDGQLPAEDITDDPAPTGETAPQSDTGTATEPTVTSGQPQIFQDGFFNHETGEFEEFLFYYDTVPTCTVELYLFPGALPEDALWSLVRTAWNLRFELFYFLGAGLLLFAIAAVYLCCAAGRQPGSTEIRAGGLNRLPLDLYLAAGAAAEFCILVLLLRSTDALLRSAPTILVPVWVLGGALACLILVSFLFALVAQIKTPGGYWWRRSFTGFLLLKLWVGCKWLGRACLRLRDGLRSLVAMMPLIWQWLLTAAAMVLIPAFAFLMILTDFLEFFWVLVLIAAIAADIAMVCYGAYCFGILMKGARQMAQGDLDHKVPTGYLYGCFQDFAHRLNELAGAAQQAAARQMRSERMKTELITNVSHDIKTPLTSIINYVDLMQKPHTQEEGTAYLEVLSRQSLRLKKLVDDLMDMSKASTGNMTVEIDRVDAAEAINQSLGEFADKLTLAQLLPVFRPPEEPVYMMADGKLVWRVMSNLLSNAVKYALPGTRLYIDLAQVDHRVVISLKNISREELNVSADELVERFVRGDASRNTEGSGLGLNIAQSLMELQRGQLRLLVDGDLFKVTLLFPAAE